MPSEGLADPSGWLVGHVALVAWRGHCLCFGVCGKFGSTGRDNGSAFVSLGLLVFRGLLALSGSQAISKREEHGFPARRQGYALAAGRCRPGAQRKHR